jgi:hypothetical protein
MQSSQGIYNAMRFGGQILKWTQEDWFAFFSNLTVKGFIWDVDDNRLRQKGFLGLMNNTPWIHAKSTPQKHCSMDHNIIYNNWGIIHPRCLECWKVVVSPRNFHELLLMEQLQKHMDVDSKCGIEMRDYTPRHYGAYFYNNSLDEGREKYKLVKEAVAANISPECAATTILKRGCTEYEMQTGPSLYWNITKQQEKILEIIEAFVDVRRGHGEQPEMLKRNVRMKWVLWAHSNGDMTYKAYNGDQAVFPGYVSYHEGDIGDIKHDIAVARAQASAGIPPETSDKFIEVVQNFAKEYKVQHYGELVKALGSNYSSPLNMKFGIKQNLDIAEEAKGDLDETT